MSKAPSARRRETSFLDVQPNPRQGSCTRHAHCDPGHVDTRRDSSTYGSRIKASSDTCCVCRVYAESRRVSREACRACCSEHERVSVSCGFMYVCYLHIMKAPPQSPPTSCEDVGGREPPRRPRTRRVPHTIVAPTRAQSRSTNLSIYL